MLLQREDDRALTIWSGEPVELAAVDRDTFVHVRRLEGGARLAVRAHHLHDRQIECAGEGEVALVVRRHGHHRARPVAADDVVGNPDGEWRTGERVQGDGARGHARLPPRGGNAVAFALSRGRLHVGAHLLPARGRRDPGDEGVLGRQHDVGDAHQRVRPRGEHLDVGTGMACHREADGGALGATDPAALRGQRPLRPVDECEVLRQPVGVGGDAQHPLPERRAHDRESADLALAVDDLLVGQHRAEAGAPVDGDLVLVREPTFEELEEDPLRPADVARIGRVDLARPVVAEAEHSELALERGHVVARGRGRVRARADGVLLGGQPKGVPAHRVQHVVAAHPQVPTDDVGRRVPLGMADMEPSGRGVREHVEDVALVPSRAAHRAKRRVLVPEALPAGLHLTVVVRGGFGVDPVAVRGHGSAIVP